MSRVKLIAVVSDIHFPDHDPAFWRAFRKWHREHRPDHTIMLGDMMDMEGLSSYPKGIHSKLQFRPEAEIFIREANALAEEAKRVTMVEGNHEDRHRKKVIEPLAAHIKGVPGFTLEEQCRSMGLKKSIEWVRESAEVRGVQVGQVLCSHGHLDCSKYGSKYPAMTALVETFGQSSLRGHSHQAEMKAIRTPRGTVEIAIQNGHGQDMKRVNYTKKTFTWVHTFSVLYLDSKTDRATGNLVIVENGRFAYGRRVYDGNRPEASGHRAVASRARCA